MNLYKTIREVYLDVLTEVVKEESPTLYLEDFLYYYNKAISEYNNLRYEKFELTQQLTDDMRAWKKEHIADSLITSIDSIGLVNEAEKFKCSGYAKKMTAIYVDALGDGEPPIEPPIPEHPILEPPIPEQPLPPPPVKGPKKLKYMNDWGIGSIPEPVDPVDPIVPEEGEKKEAVDEAAITEMFLNRCLGAKVARYRHLISCIISVELKRPIKHCDQAVGKPKRYKVTRASAARAAGIVDNEYFDARFYRPYFDIKGDKLTIDVGDINPKWIKISNITIEYLKQPAVVKLTEEELRMTTDMSATLEFPIDVSDAITKRALLLILERNGNPRMQTHIGVNQTVNDISLGGGEKK